MSTAVHVLLMGGVQVGLWAPTPSPWGMAQPHLLGTSPGFASTVHSACLVSILGQRYRLMVARHFAFCVCVVCVCVHTCMRVCVHECMCVCV